MKFLNTKPTPSAEDFGAVADLLGFALPEDLREHYSRFNGGHPVPSLFPKGGELYEVHDFFPIGHGHSLEEAYRNVVVGNERFPSHLIPIASDPGGDLYCYSVNPTEMGAIYLYQSDYYDDPGRALVFLSKDLSSFLAGLVKDPSH